MAENNRKSNFPGFPGGRTYYVSIPIRPLTGDVAEEHLQRLTLYFLVYGLVVGVVGALAIVLPILFSIEILKLLAWLLIVCGAVTLLQFVLICGAPGTTSFLVLGALHLAGGLFLVLQPVEGHKRFIFLFAVWFLAHGIIKIFMSWTVSKVTTWPAVFVSAIASIALAVLTVLLTNKYGWNLIAIFFGSDLAFTGVCLLLISCMAYLGRGHRAVSDIDARHEPLLGNRGPPAAALNV